MKKIIVTSVCLMGLFLFSVNSTFAQSNDFKLGVGLIYGSEIENLGIKADGYYAINEEFRAGASFGYFFPDDITGGSRNWSEIDLNMNYIFMDEHDTMFYGIGGLNIAIISTNFDSNLFNDTSTSEIGLNIGGGLEHKLDFGALFGEIKFAGIGGDADQLVIGAGLRFSLN